MRFLFAAFAILLSCALGVQADNSGRESKASALEQALKNSGSTQNICCRRNLQQRIAAFLSRNAPPNETEYKSEVQNIATAFTRDYLDVLAAEIAKHLAQRLTGAEQAILARALNRQPLSISERKRVGERLHDECTTVMRIADQALHDQIDLFLEGEVSVLRALGIKLQSGPQIRAAIFGAIMQSPENTVERCESAFNR